MSWSRFKFYCIEVTRLLENGLEVVPAFENAQASVLSKEFGAEFKPRDVQSAILTSLKHDGYTRDEIKWVLAIYNDMDLSALMLRPSRIRRAGVYIGYLAFMYLVLSGIYFLYVVPEMSSMFDAMEIPPPENFIWFVNNWTAILVCILIFLVALLLISTTIKEMFDYKQNFAKSTLYRFLLPRGIKARYEKLTSLLSLPLHVVKHQNDGNNNAITQHYYSEKYQPREIAGTLSLLIGENVTRLLMLSESFIRRIYVIVAILIICSIFIFVNSAYAPLFAMGEVV